MKRAPLSFLVIVLALLVVGGAQGDAGAQARLKPLTPAEQEDLDTLSAQRRASERKSDETRRTARQIAQEIEDLRQQIIAISKHQGVSEQRAAIYRAKLASINLQETDIERKLAAARNKEARLLSALQFYTRNPPPALFLNPRKANDAVIAAILMREIAPELQKRTDVLVQQNAQLIALRREAALQNGALLVSEGDVSEQRRELEKLISQKGVLEDQLLNQADALEASAAQLRAREDKMRGVAGLASAMGLKADDSRLEPPVVGETLRTFGQLDAGGRPQSAARGVSYLAQPGAQVTSPVEGEVEFAGPLASYGQVVIINAGGDYRAVLTGLGRIYVNRGQTVGRKEPLGRMPVLTDRKVVLYMELRRGDAPVNPDSQIRLSGN